MRNLVYAATALSLVGCLSQSAFEEKFAEKFCEEWDACNTASACPSTEGTGEETECDYDAGAAKDCLNEEWTCNDEFPGFEFPVSPTACANVCGDVGGDTDMSDMSDAM